MGDLSSLVGQEADLVVRFIALLRQEQEVLTQGDTSGLAPVAEKKMQLVNEMNTLAEQRNQILLQCKLEKDRPGMSDWLEQNPGDRATRESWSRLLHLAEEARELHRQNGRLLAIHLKATNDALAILNQQAQKSALYGPDGQSSHPTGNRIIDSV